MTRDDIIHMFHEAGESAGWKPGIGNQLVINYLTHFAALVAAQEREACAQLCDIRETMFKGYKAEGLPALCAAAIRARGETK